MLDDEKKRTPGWRKATRIFVEGPARRGEPIVNKTEVEELGDTELGEATEIRLRHAQCGHILHTAQEAAGISECGRVLCNKCAQNVCHHCGALVCPEHLRRVRKGEEEVIYCSRCRPWAFLEDWPAALAWLFGGLLVFMLVRSFGGC